MSKQNFNFKNQIDSELKSVSTVPKEAELPFSVTDELGATGVIAVASRTENGEYYMNALVAGNTLTISALGDLTIKSLTSTKENDTIHVEKNGKMANFIPHGLFICGDGSADDEIIRIVMSDGNEYILHMLNNLMPYMSITGAGVTSDNKGVYTFLVDQFLIRVSTDEEILYFRDMSCLGNRLIENFCPQKNGTFTYFVELHKEYRQPSGGYSSGVYFMMDENYVEDSRPVTLKENSNPGHEHGIGYLDQHEFVVIEKGHYLLASYTMSLVENLPETVNGISGTSTTYVWAGIFQEVKDGTLIKEINTTDYPFLYESAVEGIDYENSKNFDEASDTNADVVMDYVHPNSLDYQLGEDGTVVKLLVSMRNQCAVYQFDMASGEIDWILGGKSATLSGCDEYKTIRKDKKGKEFEAFTYAQHYARYIEYGNPTVIGIFDNETDPNGFPYLENKTRTIKVSIDANDKTALVSDVIDGSFLDTISEKLHSASHCGSVEYISSTSVVIGWGLNFGVDTGMIQKLGIPGYEKLVPGSCPIFTEYDLKNKIITMELSLTRNPNRVALLESWGVGNKEALFSYRTYKTEK